MLSAKGFLFDYPCFRENYKLIVIDDNGFMIIYNLMYKYITTQCYYNVNTKIKYKTDTEAKYPRVSKTSNTKTMLLRKLWGVCNRSK